jgi:hypothetical protein
MKLVPIDQTLAQPPAYDNLEDYPSWVVLMKGATVSGECNVQARQKEHLFFTYH